MKRARILLISIILLLVAPPFIAAAGETSTTLAAKLSVSVNPPALPCDGETYAAVAVALLTEGGQPTVALANTTVYLTVSQTSVGTIPKSIVISAGQTFVIANFTTTTTPGVTTITASAAGLASSFAQLTTATPSGFADHIQVFATPSTLLARPADQGTVILELTDDQGLPAKASSDVVVHLFSSDTSVVSLTEDTITIPQDESLASGTFDTSFTPGPSTVTASASGYISGGTTISVVGPAPLKLAAAAQPSSLVLNSQGLLMITLTDQSGDPARAPSPVNVTLRSSNTTVATVPNAVVITPGSIYAWVNYYSTSAPGTATITVTSPGLEASVTSVTTYAHTSPVSLKVMANPSVVLSDNGLYSNTIVVELMGANGHPAVANSTYAISLSSSNSQVGTLPSSLEIPLGSSYSVTFFQSTYASGTTTITASATNLVSDAISMATFGPVPYQISLSIYGSTGGGTGTELPANGGSYPALAVTLMDSGGGPAVAPQSLEIQLSSSKTVIVSVNSTITIPQGSIGTLVPLQTSTLPGSSNLTASSAGLASGKITVTTEIPAPTKVAAYLAPAAVLQPETGNAPYLYVQLQDSAGNPARARVATSVVVTSSNAGLFNTTMFLTIPQGADYTRLELHPLGVGTTTLTASSSGLASANAPLQVLKFPFSANLTLSAPVYIYANETNTATLSIALLGQPLSNVSVTWSFHNVVADPSNGSTNSAGELSTVLKPVGPGPANVTAFASDSEFGRLRVSAVFAIEPVPAKPSPTLAHEILSYVYYIIAAAAVAIVAGAFVLRRRRAHTKAELEAGFEAVS